MPRASRSASRTSFAALAAAMLLSLLGAAELGLRAAGSLLERRSAEPPASAGVLRVLCVGESTTAPTFPGDYSWPKQMGALLGPGYAVFNRGRVGTLSPIIADRLPWLLDAVRPHVVITMMGINDAGGLDSAGAGPRAPSLRLVRVWRWARHELGRRRWLAALERRAAEEDTAAAQRRRAACAEAADARLGALDLSLCEETLKEALAAENAADGARARARLMDFHIARGSWERADALWRGVGEARREDALIYSRFHLLTAQRRLEEAAALARSVEASRPADGLGTFLRFKLAADSGRLDAAALAAGEKAYRLSPEASGWAADLANAYASLGRWEDADRMMEPLRRRGLDKALRAPVRAFGLARISLARGRAAEAERIYLLAAAEEAQRRPAVEGVAELLLRAGRRDEAAALYGLLMAQDAATFALTGASREEQTRRSYARVGALLRERGAVWIALQYPLRPLDGLRVLTAGFPEARLVELREPFLAARRRDPGARHFYDRFAGDFGHLTPEGQALIAAAAASAVRAAGVRP